MEELPNNRVIGAGVVTTVVPIRGKYMILGTLYPPGVISVVATSDEGFKFV